MRTIRPAPCRSSRRPSGARNTGPPVRSPMARSTARAVRGASGIVTTLPPLAGARQRPVPALHAPVLDVRAGGLADPQPVQREQRDQRVPRWRAEPGSGQQRAGLVAVQRGGAGLAGDPGPPDAGGRGAIQELFSDRVLTEPADGGQPPGDGRPGPAPGLQVAGETLDVRTADSEQGQRAAAAPAGKLAQAQRVRLASQAAVPGQEPRERDPPGTGDGGLDRGERGGRGGSGHRAPPGQAGTGKPGQSRPQQLNGNPP